MTYWYRIRRLALSCLLGLAASHAGAENWPTRLHDIYRTGVTSESVSLPLEANWTYTTACAPAPAWTESPAIHDYLHEHYDLKPRQHFDRCFDLAIWGDTAYFASSITGAVYAISGKGVGQYEIRWRFFTDGPVRFAPHASEERLYVGSDDGAVYCLDRKEGALIWKEHAGPGPDLIWGNQQMMSVWPVRTSVLLCGEAVYWTCGIFPEEGIFVCKRNARDGRGGWTLPAVAPHQGYSLGVDGQFIAPTGKTWPRAYSMESGKFLGDINSGSRDGGCWALVTPDKKELWFGPSVENSIKAYDRKKKSIIATVPNANNLIVQGAYAYFTTDTAVAKLARESGDILWKRDIKAPYALIKTAGALFLGGDGAVMMLDLEGKKRWEAAVTGGVYGLAFANGRLYASTDRGGIHVWQSAK